MKNLPKWFCRDRVPLLQSALAGLAFCSPIATCGVYAHLAWGGNDKIHLVRFWQTILLLLMLSITSITSAQTDSDVPLDAPLFALNTIEQDAIMLYDVNADAVRRLSLGAYKHHVWDFSPDGCRLLVTLQAGALPPRLVSVDLRGQDVRELVRYPELPADEWGVWEPDWSPASAEQERIAFTMMRVQPVRGVPTRETHIAYVTPDDPTPEFFSVTGREYAPTWSHAGDWLAYISYDERVPGADLYSTAVPTAEPPPNVTPPEPTTVSEADLWVVSADGESKYRLTNFSVGSVSKPRWSPDDELVGFVYSMSNGNDMVWMIGNAESASPTQLSNQWSMALDLTWLPDGTQMIASLREFRDVVENRLWRIPLVGLADETGSLYLPSANLLSADWVRFSPDGRYLAVRSAYELALVDLRDSSVRLLGDWALGNTSAVWAPSEFMGEMACP
jgi:WD40 repeat protein